MEKTILKRIYTHTHTQPHHAALQKPAHHYKLTTLQFKKQEEKKQCCREHGGASPFLS